VSIALGTAEVLVDLPATEAPWSADDARRWLDEQFIANDCVPLRASASLLPHSPGLADALIWLSLVRPAAGHSRV
jgi:hypothetical protein